MPDPAHLAKRPCTQMAFLLQNSQFNGGILGREAQFKRLHAKNLLFHGVFILRFGIAQASERHTYANKKSPPKERSPMSRTVRTPLACAKGPVSRSLLCLFCLTVLICGSAVHLRAQTTNAIVNGQVTDAQDRPVPGVDVQAVNIDTNVVYSGETNGSGIS